MERHFDRQTSLCDSASWIVQRPIEAGHPVTPRRAMDLYRQALGNDGYVVTGLQSVRDFLTAPAVERLTVAVGHR